MQQATTPQTCAIVLEPIQGEGGVNVPNPSYLPAVRRWCDENKMLLILDEVQTGMCRTGPLFAYQGMGVEPDVMTLAKGLGGGVPVAAILAKEHASVFTPGDHGSTFGGNPLATAAALAVTRFMLDNDMPAQVARTGAYLTAKLEALRSRFAFVTGVRGKGLLLALGFEHDIAERVTMESLRQGLIINNVRPNAIRLAPPLTVTEAECDEAVGIIERVLGVAAPAK
jgi:acetylornithine/succinyldiaminopimelate/putrescine aminotransferase